MMSRVSCRTPQLVLLGLTLLLGGCGSSDEPAEAKQPRPQDVVDRGTPVTVVSEQDDLAQVRTDDGREFYVPTSVLQEKSTVNTDGTFSHTLTAPVYAYLTPPEGPLQLPPQTKRELLIEQLSLNTLFLTEKTKREVIAPANSQPTFEGELCWPTYFCTNPECPAKDQGKNGRPFLFINSKLGSDTLCPACRPLWASQQNDPDTLQRYRHYPRAYELPESLRRREQITALRKQAAARRRAKSAAPP